MGRPARFEEFRYLGDKRSQRFYDLDDDAPAVVAAVEELVASRSYLAFAPDTPAEARNRGYRPARVTRRTD